jgi:deoxyribodipyrimidine photo-lyase
VALKKQGMVNIKRVRNLKKGPNVNGPVLYWMSRDQRIYDNWALSYALEISENTGQHLMVLFNLYDDYPGATWRHYDFMLKGLRKIESRLKELNIPFSVVVGDPAVTIPKFIRQHHISHMVTDFDPLKIKRSWKESLLKIVEIPVDEVDAHNIVPCWLASDKEEFAAYTFRPKIKRRLPEFLDEFPPIVRQHGNFHPQRINWEAIGIALKTDRDVRPVEWLTPGPKAALAVLDNFIERKIEHYADGRDDPNQDAVSNLSPYLHFGHISAQRIAIEILQKYAGNSHAVTFLEELIVRRELADNFCYYNQNYDSTEGFKPWAKITLDAHRKDHREYLYTCEQFENALTHDRLWNAAQMQLVCTGKMAGYLRMYWAKKILEWTASPEKALKTAIYLNDKYSLDGRDPNGYTGCAWSVGGIHDRPWGERDIFGKIRYMNRNGCARKFNVDAYISRIDQICVSH